LADRSAILWRYQKKKEVGDLSCEVGWLKKLGGDVKRNKKESSWNSSNSSDACGDKCNGGASKRLHCIGKQKHTSSEAIL